MVGKTGRPVGDSDARERLIVEARKLFVSLPYSKVSTRMIASRADVNVALIRYYFASKAGLYEAMLRETITPIHAQLKVTLNKGDFASIGDLMRTYYRIMAPNPDMPKLIARAMMMEPADLQRQTMEKIFNEVARPAIEVMFLQLQKQGVLRGDVCPDKARMSFISLMVFPFLIPPSLLTLQNIEMDETYLAELAEHNVNLLVRGLTMPKEENKSC
ncbi:TetR/AcrR family transcriptional regulator [Photobacterium gaetbulicola]|uniref:Putative transcriptional regulator n=1 Tax=Photobacterium gaetbulicola Gung47 TaxID=658445 RepID=A0A0C5WS16_9GAMM|nr:TetR/AcrR family transcriptional regulator [Photobacterium gaetbulicola]AJR09988.1 putative transcriptional regulator [Photobacterium gaetbulicola Gung47]PSU05844.1 TetR/AcrR family transcriptional regulator [Photobacterium gaetbulicola]